jgi:hypothetical protein
MSDTPAKQGWGGIRNRKPGGKVSPFDGVIRSESEDEELNKLFARIFRGRQGEIALQYLRSLTKDMVLGDGLNTTQLIHTEGQRWIVHLMERRAEYGRSGKPTAAE